MARRKTKGRKRKSNLIPIIAIGLGVLLLVFFMLNQYPKVTENPDGTTTVSDLLDEDDVGEINDAGDCVGDGEETVAVCCWDWSTEINDLIAVPCKHAEDTQAFFTFQGGAKSGPHAAFQFGINLDNTGNSVAEVRIKTATAVATTNGDAAGVAEIEAKIANVAGTWNSVAAGADLDLSSNPVLIDTPGFSMTDGVYTITFDVEAREVGDASTETVVAQAVVTAEVEQEELSFSIDVTSI